MFLMNAGKFTEAYEILKLALVDSPADQDVRFLLGHCAMELNRPAEAIALFEAMLAANPNLPRVRLDLGRAYVAERRFDLAREQFNQVIASNPPPQVGDNIQKFFSMMDAQRPLHLRLSVAMMSDSNVNTGPGSASILTVAPTSETITNRSDNAWNAVVSVNHVHTVNNQFAWQSEVSVNSLDYIQEQASDLLILSASTGPTVAVDKFVLSVPLVYDNIVVGHDPYSHSKGIAPQLQYSYSTDVQFTGGFSNSRRKYHRVASLTRNGQVSGVTAGARIKAGESLQLQPTLRFGREHAYERQFNNQSQGLSLGVSTPLPEGFSLYLQPGVTRTVYAIPDPFLAGACNGCEHARRDWQYAITANLSKPIGKTGLTAALGYTYTRNDSNVGLYDYSRHQGTAMLTWIY
ncbi:MAG: DUF560 domain-containing protein [Betaproteobacteria bacterium]|nr:DUF560 domain-containing protein [Betaproteobacteria bacterium]